MPVLKAIQALIEDYFDLLMIFTKRQKKLYKKALNDQQAKNLDCKINSVFFEIDEKCRKYSNAEFDSIVRKKCDVERFEIQPFDVGFLVTEKNENLKNIDNKPEFAFLAADSQVI